MKALHPLLAALAVVAVLVVVVVVSRRAAPPAPPPPAGTPAPTPVPVQVVLFYPGDDTLLHREVREVPELPADTSPRARVVLEELIAGSREGFAPAFPWQATVEAVFLDRAGNAYVDLSPPPAGAVAGSAGEVALAYATVNSLVANCPGVSRVQLLFGGRQVETLGHLDLSRPLAPQPGLVAP